MKTDAKPLIILLLCLSSFPTHAVIDEQACIDSVSTIEQKLACLEGVSFKELNQESTPVGVRRFELQFTQLVDHNNPNSPKFNQRARLLHRGLDQPSVLATVGYYIDDDSWQHEVTSAFQTNQVEMEYRYFEKSAPAVLDWRFLNIEQASADFHRVSLALKKIYKQSWIAAGLSKGGIAMLNYKRKYPQDVVAVFASSAPVATAIEDSRYVQFVQDYYQVKYPLCIQNLTEVGKNLIHHETEIAPRRQGRFTMMGGPEQAFELEVSYIYHSFWAEQNATNEVDCSAIPAGKPLEEQYQWYHKIMGTDRSWFSDEENEKSLAATVEYYIDLGNQMRYGQVTFATDFKHKASWASFLPKDFQVEYSNQEALDLIRWMENDADRVLMTYGEFDLWRGGSLPLSKNGHDVSSYMIPKGGHLSTFQELPMSEKQQVMDKLASWLGKMPKDL